MKVAVVGATGLVGSVMLELLEERKFPITELLPVASERSVGKQIEFKGKIHNIISMETAIAAKPAIALFSAGGDISKKFAEMFAANGTKVIDNSSAWRMDSTKKLIVPEVNALELTATDNIIANPNCSTIQMMVAVSPLHHKYGIDRMVISTYQSITGSGVKALKQLENEQKGLESEKAYPYPIHLNCIPQCDVFEENDYTKEEMKLINESRKILGESDLKITATAVRIPTVGGHSESVNITFKNDFEMNELKSVLSNTKGIIVQDSPADLLYPMPLFTKDKDEVFVGRIRRDESAPNSLNFWIVADNLRKGAATNAIQIAEYLVGKQLV